MITTDVFGPVELQAKPAKTPGQLMEYADALMFLARTKKFRRQHGMNPEHELIGSSDEAHEFPIITWNKRIGGTDVSLSLVDKRQTARLGFVLTVLAGVGVPENEVVKVFVVNDELGHRGFRRAVNKIEPEDVAGVYLDAWHRSKDKYQLSGSVDKGQSLDYQKAIATAYLR